MASRIRLVPEKTQALPLDLDHDSGLAHWIGTGFLKRFRGLRLSKKCYTVTSAKTVSLESKRSPIGDERTVLHSPNTWKRPRIANHLAGILARVGRIDEWH